MLRFDRPNLTLYLLLRLDLPNPKHCLPSLHGHHRRRSNLPPSPRHRARGFHARHESQLGDIPPGAGVRAEVPARAYLGAVLQHHIVCDWDVD